MGLNPPTTNPVTDPTTFNNPKNIFFPTSGLPAVIKQHARNSVVISGKKLGEMLEKFHTRGINRVDLVVEIEGRQIVVTGSIYKKTNKHTKQSYYYIYPLGVDQVFLRKKYLTFRGAAESHSKTPLPIIVYSIIPKI
jgi:hypothetical protein